MQRAGNAGLCPGDHFGFLSGANKDEVVRLDNLAVGVPQVQVFPVAPDGTIRNGTPMRRFRCGQDAKVTQEW